MARTRCSKPSKSTFTRTGAFLARLLFVALRQEQGRPRLGEHADVDAGGVGVDVVELEGAQGQVVVPVGEEVEIAAGRVKGRFRLGREVARELPRLPLV